MAFSTTMKWGYWLTLLASSLVLMRCFFLNKKIIYVFNPSEENFVFSPPDTTATPTDSIHFWSSEINTSKKEPFSIHFIISEPAPLSEQLKAVEVTIFSADKENNRIEIPSENNLKIEYFDGQRINSRTLKNNTQPLNTLVEWKEVQYTYEFLQKEYQKKDNPVSYFFSYKFPLEKYPDSLTLEVTLVWKNGENTIQRVLTKTEYKGPKFNPKF